MLMKMDWSNVYGKLKTPPYKGTGRRPDPVIVPSDDLKYAQVCKRGDSDGKINTSYVERLNLTIRNSLARFIRRTMNESKDPVMHSKALDFIQAWYNFVKPHRSLRVKENDGRRKWRQRTPENGRRTYRSSMVSRRDVHVQGACSMNDVHDPLLNLLVKL